MIRLARNEDLQDILEILEDTIKNFKHLGIDQWQNGYPNLEVFKEDIANNNLYIYEEENKVLAFMAFIKENDINYLALSSFESNHSAVLHRIAVRTDCLKKGIASKMFEYAIDEAKKLGFKSLKIDTHKDNFKMLSLINKYGFSYRGYLENIDREAFELMLERGE